MLPVWIKIQKISILVYLAAGILLLIYSLGFITDVYVFYAYGADNLIDFYYDMQDINSGLLWKAVFVIIFSLILFMLGLGKHPAGFITLIIVSLITSASIFICVNSFDLLFYARYAYSELDLSSLNRFIERGTINYTYSTLIYELGILGYGLLLLSSVFTAGVVTRNAFLIKTGV